MDNAYDNNDLCFKVTGHHTVVINLVLTGTSAKNQLMKARSARLCKIVTRKANVWRWFVLDAISID